MSGVKVVDWLSVISYNGGLGPVDVGRGNKLYIPHPSVANSHWAYDPIPAH